MKDTFKLSVLVAILVLVGCKKIDASKGTKIDHQVDLTLFNAIDMGIAGEMTFTQDDVTSITVNCTEKVFKALELSVKNDQLLINSKNGYIITNSEDIKISISAPDINSLSLSGSGIVEANFKNDVIPNLNLEISGSGQLNTNTINASTVKQSISGSGSLTSTIFADKIQSIISGSGILNVSGNTFESDISLSSSGAFKGYDLITKSTSIEISGSGIGEVHSDSTLTVEITGSGSVFYKGQPVINSSGSGSGSLINAN